MNKSLNNKYIRIVIIAGAVVSALAYFFFFNPANLSQFAPCPFNALTGLYCPGCGSSRAINQLLHGNLYAALKFNPLTVFLMPIVSYLFLSEFIFMITGKWLLPRWYIRSTWIWAFLTVILTFWILRNIPYYPFSILVP